MLLPFLSILPSAMLAEDDDPVNGSGLRKRLK